MQYTRQQAVARIREYLVANTREDETTCLAAARLGVFCRGYEKWTTESLRHLYPWLAKKLAPDAPREELMRLIIAWDGARQVVHDTPTTCDTKTLDEEGCLGFERFQNENLKRMFPVLFHPDDEIIGN